MASQLKKNKTEDNFFFPEIFQLCIFTVSIIIRIKMRVTRNGGGLVAKPFQILWDSMDCSPLGSSVHKISQARILEWVPSLDPQGIFLTQGLKPGLLHCRQFLYQLSYKVSPIRNTYWADSSSGYPFTPTSLVAQWLSNCLPMQETWVGSLGWENPLEDKMATHPSILAWRIPGQRSLVGYSLQGPTQSDRTEAT